MKHFVFSFLLLAFIAPKTSARPINNTLSGDTLIKPVNAGNIVLENVKQLNWNDVIQDSVANVIGGLCFALIIFALNEYFFKKRNVSGEWKVKIKIDHSAYNPYKGVGIEYCIHLLQLGTEISGRGEKTADINPDGTTFHKYPHVKRIQVEITGYYEQNYLKPSRVYLLVRENGSKRITTASYDLQLPYFNTTKLIGEFTSTAADSRGKTNWKKIS